jgi:hypothetical protein
MAKSFYPAPYEDRQPAFAGTTLCVRDNKIRAMSLVKLTRRNRPRLSPPNNYRNFVIVTESFGTWSKQRLLTCFQTTTPQKSPVQSPYRTRFL